jgi:SAM-dependent methyltransferase
MTLHQDYFIAEGLLPSQVFNDTVKEVLTLCRFRNPKRITVLDVGSGYGEYAFALAPQVKRVIGVEPFGTAYKQAVAHNHFRNVRFYNRMIEDFTTPERFDLILSLTTLEHMPDADASFRRIFELLKPGGKIYLTAPNKLWPWEHHYNLPFLSWLPLPLANAYLRLFRDRRSYEDSSYAKTYWGLRSFLGKFPCTYRFVVPDPDASYLGWGQYGRLERTIKDIGIRSIRRFPSMWAFSKGFIVLIEKTAH